MQAVNKIFEYLTGVNLFEAGAKLFQTLIDGIKSMISKPVEIVQAGLQKIRNLLPFSDAKEGPLSQLTLSGRKILETISAGVGTGAQALKSSVDSAMKPVAAGIAGLSIAMAPIMPPEVNAAPVPAHEALADWMPQGVETPFIPDISGSASWNPNPVSPVPVPDISGSASWNPNPVSPVPVPDISGSASWNPNPVSPVPIPDISGSANWTGQPIIPPAMQGLTASADWQPGALHAPTAPDISAKAFWQSQAISPPVMPDLTGTAFWENQTAPKPATARPPVAQSPTSQTGGKTVKIQNLTVNLPGVKNAEDFTSQLQRLVEQMDG
jgi:hypothetical protein